MSEHPVTPLSPATQAVLDAFGNARDGEYIEGVWVVDEHTMIAAAIRAVANQVKLEKPLGSTDADAGVFAAHHAIYSQLLSIAAELDGGEQYPYHRRLAGWR